MSEADPTPKPETQPRHFWPIYRPPRARQHWSAGGGFFFLLLSIGVLFLAAVALAYALKFGGGGLSDTQADWAAFGEYVGGTAGGLFGLLAFIGVLAALRMQQHHLDELKRQAAIDEIQRLLSSVSRSVDVLLAGSPNCANDEIRAAIARQNSAFTMYSLLAGAGTAALREVDSESTALLRAYIDRDFRAALDLQAAPIATELHQLAWILLQHKGAAGTDVVFDFYRLRYGAVVCWMDAMGISLSPICDMVFEPTTLRPILANSQATSMSLADNC